MAESLSALSAAQLEVIQRHSRFIKLFATIIFGMSLHCPGPGAAARGHSCSTAQLMKNNVPLSQCVSSGTVAAHADGPTVKTKQHCRVCMWHDKDRSSKQRSICSNCIMLSAREDYQPGFTLMNLSLMNPYLQALQEENTDWGNSFNRCWCFTISKWSICVRK